ncbi:ABC transporter ATP-binding protein [uncultured Methanobrevibacter sp.]|uniref:ABC transporter ATP-binding protein n=1 Tax=uncultured Methanobrevibacter sp. TaxID=253161 RepID=UPI0025CFF5B4|nr:ABC transporter ATP-binding protein [uncultured Methanobrevibacter sp.]
MDEKYSKIYLVKKFYGYVSEFRNHFILVAILMIASISILVYAPKYMGGIINSVVNSFIFSTPFSIDDVNDELIGIMVLYIIGYSLRIPINRIMSKISEKTTANFKFSLEKKLSYLSPNTFNHIYSGNVMARLNNDVANIKSFVNKAIILFVGDVLIVIFVVIASISLNPLLSLLFIAAVPIYLIIMYLSYRKSGDTYKIHQDDLGQQMGLIGNHLINRLPIHSYNAKEYSKKKFVKSNDIQKDSFIKSRFYTYISVPFVYLLTYVVQIAVYFIAGYLAYNGIITLGVLSTFAFYVQFFKRPLMSLSSVFTSVMIGLSSFARVLEVLEYPVNDDIESNMDNLAVNGDIEFKNVSYKNISDFSLKIDEGQTINFVGENKDDLIDLLLGFESASEGEIFLNNKNINELSLNSYRQLFGVSLEEDFIIRSSIHDNISYGGDNLTADDVVETCKFLEIHDLIESFPDKYDTSISNDFQNFSSGEAKLICVARAIVSNPEILILNYPNYLTTSKLKRICENRTVIILTPDDTFIDFADNTVYLD